MSTTTYRELLELAAKAAGIIGQYVENYGSGDYYYTGNIDGILCDLPDGGMYVWNPITDDGDALRLAVKLNLRIVIQFDHVEVEAPGGFAYERESFGDSCAATRRAIVRAAAELGRNMP